MKNFDRIVFILSLTVVWGTSASYLAEMFETRPFVLGSALFVLTLGLIRCFAVFWCSYRGHTLNEKRLKPLNQPVSSTVAAISLALEPLNSNGVISIDVAAIVTANAIEIMEEANVQKT